MYNLVRAELEFAKWVNYMWVLASEYFDVIRNHLLTRNLQEFTYCPDFRKLAQVENDQGQKCNFFSTQSLSYIISKIGSLVIYYHVTKRIFNKKFWLFLHEQ